MKEKKKPIGPNINRMAVQIFDFGELPNFYFQRKFRINSSPDRVNLYVPRSTLSSRPGILFLMQIE
jgi:hypothetical protein